MNNLSNLFIDFSIASIRILEYMVHNCPVSCSFMDIFHEVFSKASKKCPMFCLTEKSFSFRLWSNCSKIFKYCPLTYIQHLVKVSMCILCCYRDYFINREICWRIVRYMGELSSGLSPNQIVSLSKSTEVLINDAAN